MRSPIATHWWSLAAVAVLLLVLPTKVTGSIVVDDKEFASREEKTLGHRLWKGYAYMGRLQFVEGNLQLCRQQSDPSHRFQITPTTDGIPGMQKKDRGTRDNANTASLSRVGCCLVLHVL